MSLLSHGATKYIQHEQETKIPPFAVLRAHPAPVTCIDFLKYSISSYHAPTSSCSSSKNTNFHSFLASADESGYIYIWSIPRRRPISIFKPHNKPIIGIRFLAFTQNADDKSTEDSPKISRIILLSHGRDHVIKFFDVTSTIFASLDPSSSYMDATESVSNLPTQITSNLLRAETTSGLTERNAPIQVYELPVNALNFCPVEVLIIPSTDTHEPGSDRSTILLAVPSTLASENIDVFSLTLPTIPLPAQETSLNLGFNVSDVQKDYIIRRICTGIPGPDVPETPKEKRPKDPKKDLNKDLKFGPMDDDLDEEEEAQLRESLKNPRSNGTGIVMSLALAQISVKDDSKYQFFNLIVGYESGHVAIFEIGVPAWIADPKPGSTDSRVATFELVSVSQQHKQAVLSLGIASLRPNTKIKNDGVKIADKVVYSGGADARISCAVLPRESKLHQEQEQQDRSLIVDDLNHTADVVTSTQNNNIATNSSSENLFSKKEIPTTAKLPPASKFASKLGQKLATVNPTANTPSKMQEESFSKSKLIPNRFATYKSNDPGTAAIAVRSDSKILATAGWDGYVHVYRPSKSFELSNADSSQNKSGFVSSFYPTEYSFQGDIFKPLASFKPANHNYHQQSTTSSGAKRSATDLVGDEISNMSFGPVEHARLVSPSGDNTNVTSETVPIKSSLLLRLKTVSLHSNSGVTSDELLNPETHILAVARKDGRIGLYNMY